MDQDHDQLEEVEDPHERRRRRRQPFPVKYSAAITKLINSFNVDKAAVVAAFHKTLDQDEDLEEEEECLKKLEIQLVKQCLDELEEERRRRPLRHKEIQEVLRRPPHDASTSTSTTITDDHSGTSSGLSNEGSHGVGGFFRKQVLPADGNEIQVEEEDQDQEAVNVPSKLQLLPASRCFPKNVLLPRRSFGVIGSPEWLVFSNVVDDLDTIYMEAVKSFSLKEVTKGEIYQAISRFTDLQSLLRIAFLERPGEVIEWLKVVVTDAAINTKIVISDLIVKMARRGSKKIKIFPFFFNKDYLSARGVAIKKLESIQDNMEEQYRDVLNQVVMNQAMIPYEREPTTTSRIDEYDIHVGRGKDIDIIIKHLLSEEKRVQVISVVGMHGTGKTALAHLICSQYNLVVRRFDFFACAQSEDGGGSNDHASVLIGFLRDTSTEMLDKADYQEIVLGNHSIQHPDMFDLLRTHRYLIIIDDIMTPEAWDELRKALPLDTMNGSRILLTTCNTKVALHAIRHQPGSPPPHQLRPLREAESQELFTITVRYYLPADLVSILKKILKKCDGLPFAVKHLADHLSTQEWTKDAWANVLETADKQIDNHRTPWSYIFNMIVQDLSLDLRWCLFYFGLFPKDYAISVRRLIALWVAEGFVDKREDKTLEYIAEELLQKLIDLNMVQVTKQKPNGRPKRCCLTHYLRVHLSTRCKQANFVSNTSESSTSTSTNLWVHRLADHAEVNPSSLPASPDFYRLLLSFLSFDYREGYEPGERIRNFLYGGLQTKGHFELLRVLDLEGVYKPGLPKEMGKLIHLKYLGLRWTYMDSFPLFIGNLINLQTLDVKHTYISTLPGSIWKLRKLRHVYLNDCYLDSFVHQPGAVYLENLQTLWGIHVDEESLVLEGLNRFTKITRLGVSCNLTSASQQAAMAKWISTLDLLQSLRFRSRDRLGKLLVVHLSPFTTHRHLSDLYFHGQLEKLFEMNEFPPKLTELTLSASKLKEDPMPTLEKLPCLSILRLYCDSYIGEEMICSPVGFIRLEVLQIWKLENVKTWIIEEKSMPMLKKLEIRSCNNLVRLPVGLPQVTTLQELKLTEMPMKFINEVEKDKDKGWYKKANVCFVDWRRTSDQN